MILFKILVVSGLLVVTTIYLTRGRTPQRDRVVVLFLFASLVLAVLFPGLTSWLAEQLGVGRGVDLAFYVGFMLLFLLTGIQRARWRNQQEAITTLVREIALLKAKDETPRPPEAG